MDWVIIRPGGLKTEAATGKGVLTEDKTGERLGNVREELSFRSEGGVSQPRLCDLHQQLAWGSCVTYTSSLRGAPV
jgi:hypothetical protein